MNGRLKRAGIFCLLIGGLLASVGVERQTKGAAASGGYAKRGTWQETMLASRAALKAVAGGRRRTEAARGVWKRVERDFRLEWDWVCQDYGLDFSAWLASGGDAEIEKRMMRRVLDELGSAGEKSARAFDTLCRTNASPSDGRWLKLYVEACEERRRIRLAGLVERFEKIVFTKHYNIGGSHYAYTEGLSDAQAERHFVPGSALCVLETAGGRVKVRTLLEDREGVIRDPDVSFDGRRILFAWKKSDRQDDYHLYEMEVASGRVRQLTFGRGFADYEGAYLPNGDIIFNSTRCVQIVDCWWTEVSNLYTCDKDGRYLRRLSFDQVHTNYPTVLEDGRVIYTRWDYNDRAQIYPQALFQMNPDGTAQSEYYGNNSWFPTTIMHARGIWGTQKVVAVLSGHHSDQRGKLAIIDNRRGRQEASGVQLIAPVRATEAVRVDSYGQEGEQFQYPYAVSEREFLVSYDPQSAGNRRYSRPYAVYLMTIDGRRELLAWDSEISCNQAIPLAARERPHVRPSVVDYRKKTGTYYVQDIYFGPGLEGVVRGAVKRLRVVGLEFRAAGIGETRNNGPGGGALASTPIGVGNTSWDVKVVLGDATVYEDGSAMFEAPARMPVYFQALDEKGRMVQTMRSWSTLQPNETYSCVGCHENKNEAPPSVRKTLAMRAGPEALKPFYGPARGFSFEREVQPILDRHCISCHDGSEDGVASLRADRVTDGRAKRRWSESYLFLTGANSTGRGDGLYKGNPDGKLVRWVHGMSVPSMLAPYSAGAAKSRLIAMLEEGHEDVRLSREEMDKIACWIDLVVPYCGDYAEANAWDSGEAAKHARFVGKRLRMAELERKNIEELIAAEDLPRAGQASPAAVGDGL